MSRLDGKRVLITGASRGIGEQLANEFAGAGARVALVARSAGPLEALAARLGGSAHPADLSDPHQVEGLVDRVESDGGPLDVVVNNAGIDLTGPFVDLEPRDIRDQVQLNLTTPVELVRQAVPAMIARGGGHIVNISSLSGTNAVPGLVTYSATKAGLSHFTALVRAELKGTPIRTTLVEIGPVDTEMMRSVGDHPPTDRAIARFRRLGLVRDLTASEVAAQVVAAVRADRRHVRLPRRDALFPMMVELPRRLTEVLLTGVRA